MEPGVYWFLAKNKTVLYVGKAKNLKKRIQSYTRLPQIQGKTKKLVLEAYTIKFQVLQSELEALLVEAELIRLHQPQFNILLKDDKTPIYILITKEDFPRVLMVRKQTWEKNLEKGTVFGPFPSSYKVQQVLHIARHIYGWCNQQQKGKPCFYYHIGLCPGVCAGVISKEEYNVHISKLKDFLRGKTSIVKRSLKQEMLQYSKDELYEDAAVIRDKISYIEYVTSPENHFSEDITLPSLIHSQREQGLLELKRIISTYLSLPNEYRFERIEGYDVSNIQGTSPTASMVVFTDGQKDVSQYRIFHIRTKNTPDDFHMMREALVRRQQHPEWGYPNLVLIDGGKGQLSSALSVWNWTNPVVSIAKDPDRLVIRLAGEKKKYILVDLKEYPLVMKILEQVRDESHRFAKKHHTKRKIKDFFTSDKI